MVEGFLYEIQEKLASTKINNSIIFLKRSSDFNEYSGVLVIKYGRGVIKSVIKAHRASW